MKLNDNYIMTELGEDGVLIPIGKMAASFRGILRLNKTAVFVVNCLMHDTTTEQIVDALCEEYEAERSAVEIDVNKALDKLREMGAIQE